MIDSTLEYVQGMETIKAYRLEDSGKLVEKQVDEYCTASDRYESTLTNWNMAYKICLNIGLFLSLGIGISLIHSGALAPATYLFFAIMGIIFYRPLEALMGAFAMMNLANASLDNISEISVYVKVFNTSLLSAGIAVEVIKSILSEHHNSGVYYPFEILNNQKTIRKLIEEGVIAINGFSESYEDEEIGVL